MKVKSGIVAMLGLTGTLSLVACSTTENIGSGIDKTQVDPEKKHAVNQIFSISGLKKEKAGGESDEVHRYRVSGILTATEEDGFRWENILGIATEEGIVEYFKNTPPDELFRESNYIMTRAEMRGGIYFHLPDNAIGETKKLLWKTHEVQPVSYFEQRYFEIEFETIGRVQADWEPAIECEITDQDSGLNGDDDTVCSGTHSYNILINDFSDTEAIYNKAFFKLKSPGRNINDLPTLLERVESLGSDFNFISLVSLLHNASGIWVQNLQIADISDTDYNNNKSDFVRAEGVLEVNHATEVLGVEPYGQVYVIPEAVRLTAGEIVDALEDMDDDVDIDIPDKYRDLALVMNAGDSPALKIYDHQFDQNGQLMRTIDNGHRFVYDKWMAGMEGQTFFVFNNVWEKDDGALNYDDCWARGDYFGFDEVNFSSNSTGLSTCGKNLHNGGGEKLVFKPSSIKPYHLTEQTPWRLKTYLYFTRGDDGGPIEPYGSISVNIPSEEGAHISRVIWSDEYTGGILQEQSLPDIGIKFYSDIYFNSYSDLVDRGLELTFPGKILEKDPSGDDRYYVSDWKEHKVQLNRDLMVSGEYKKWTLETPADHKLRAHLGLKLERANNDSIH